jgi:putative hydrolase of the HAD superfamily
MSKIRAAIFDVGGPLVAYNSLRDKTFLVEQIGRGNAVPEEFWQELTALLGTGKLTEDEFWEHAAKAHGIRTVDQSERLLARSYKMAMKPRPEMLAYAGELGLRGLRLAVLSDTIAPHAEVNTAAGVYLPFGEQVYLSHQQGLRKPEPEFYERALAGLGVPANQTVFIDDKPENVEAAEMLGIQGIIAENSRQVMHDLELLLH